MKLIIQIAAQAPNESAARCRKGVVIELDENVDQAKLAAACNELAKRVAESAGSPVPVKSRKDTAREQKAKAAKAGAESQEKKAKASTKKGAKGEPRLAMSMADRQKD